MLSRVFWWRLLNKHGRARTIVLTLPAEVGRCANGAIEPSLRDRRTVGRRARRTAYARPLVSSRAPPEAARCAQTPELVTIRQRLGTKNPRKTLELSCTPGPDIDRI